MSKEDFQDGYDRGFEEGLKTADFSDAYWLRVFAGQAMQGMLSGKQTMPVLEEDIAAEQAIQARYAVKQAQAFLAEVKKCEAEKMSCYFNLDPHDDCRDTPCESCTAWGPVEAQDE